jgi:hypothetical protein
MNFGFSQHFKQEATRRGIPWTAVEAVLAAPEQKVDEHGTVVCYQSRLTINPKPYLPRVMVEEGRQPPVVVTVYRASKIGKYWQNS